MATHTKFLREIPRTGIFAGPQSTGPQRAGHDREKPHHHTAALRTLCQFLHTGVQSLQ